MITRIRAALDRLIAKHTQDFPCEVADVYASVFAGGREKTLPQRSQESATRPAPDHLPELLG